MSTVCTLPLRSGQAYLPYEHGQEATPCLVAQPLFESPTPTDERSEEYGSVADEVVVSPAAYEVVDIVAFGT